MRSYIMDYESPPLPYRNAKHRLITCYRFYRACRYHVVVIKGCRATPRRDFRTPSRFQALGVDSIRNGHWDVAD